MSAGKRAVCLVSGGLDSAVALACARRDGFACYALSIDYGQRHRIELKAAERVAQSLGAQDHKEVRIDLTAFGGSALTDDLDVPKNRGETEMTSGIPITYVPARNTIFLACALAWAERLRAYEIFLGVNAVDYSGYPDCRPAFIEAFEHLANLATKAGVEGGDLFQIHTPLITLSKKQIIQLGRDLGVDFSLTHSCYDPDQAGHPCGACDSCIIRLKGFVDAGWTDPLPYPLSVRP